MYFPLNRDLSDREKLANQNDQYRTGNFNAVLDNR